MSLIFLTHMLTTKSLSGRIFLTVLASFIIISAYFVLTSYFTSIRQAEDDTQLKLQGICRTLSIKVDGELHRQLMEKYPVIDAIKTNEQDSIYLHLHNILREVQLKNEINTPIYTLKYDSATQIFYFGVTSAENPYFRHPYASFPPRLLEYYHTGGTIPSYGDKHGTWLSAFVPLKDQQGRVGAVLQVDEKFDDFIMAARKRLIRNALISFGLLLVVALILYQLLKGILKNEEASRRKLEASKRMLEKKNKDITESIQYASYIQGSIIVDQKYIQKYLPESFVLYKPKDIVSGDFYWFSPVTNGQYFNIQKKDEQNNLMLMGVVDCTGHGVPGAIMSMLAVSLLNEIVSEGKVLEPGKILNYLNQKVIATLKQDDSDSHSRDGMDVALCMIDLNKMELQYAGAYRPLYWVNNGDLKIIKGNRFPVGGTQFRIDRSFTNHLLKVNKGDSVYCFSDGFVDQFGGKNSRKEKITSRRLRKIITDIQHLDMSSQKDYLEVFFNDWMGNEKQIDDVAFMGVKF